MVTVGIVDGVAEATAAFLKLFSGVLSDSLARRELLMVVGDALAAWIKPIFPLAQSVARVCAARFTATTLGLLAGGRPAACELNRS